MKKLLLCLLFGFGIITGLYAENDIKIGMSKTMLCLKHPITNIVELGIFEGCKDIKNDQYYYFKFDELELIAKKNISEQKTDSIEIYKLKKSDIDKWIEEFIEDDKYNYYLYNESTREIYIHFVSFFCLNSVYMEEYNQSTKNKDTCIIEYFSNKDSNVIMRITNYFDTPIEYIYKPLGE